MVNLKNGILEINVNEKGAELFNLIKNGEEFLWQGDPTFWKGRAYNLFPICGGLKDDEYIYNGNTYSLKKHGFAKDVDFILEEKTETTATFLLSSQNYQNEGYPFNYELRIVYELCGETLNVYFKIKNLDDNEMFFSIGAHEGYQLKNDITDYSVIFEADNELSRYMVEGNLVSYNTVKLPFSDKKVLPLQRHFFNDDALIFMDHKSRKVELKNNVSGQSILVEFKDFDYLLIWTKETDAPFVCIEPWTGMPDMVDSNKQIKDKKGITKLEPKSEKTFLHSITVGKSL